MTVVGGAAVTAVVAGVGWGKPQAHPNVAVRIDVPTLGFASLTPTYAGSLLVIPAQAGIQ
jgi:hypothetical protein